MKTSTQLKLFIIAFVWTCIVALAAHGGEQVTEIRTVRVKMMCDTVGCSGEMRTTGVCLTSIPPQYPHQCSVCKSNRTYQVCYPEIRYEDKVETAFKVPRYYWTPGLMLTNGNQIANLNAKQ